jgi:hypothetical protein
MTTLGYGSAVCAVCGTASGHAHVFTTCRFGWPDLDRRPPPLVRFNLRYEIQRCPQCGYCASDIGNAPDVASALVGSSRYQEQLNDQQSTWLTNYYLCAALVAEEAANALDAAWMTTRAAWVSDDENDWKGSQRARISALALFIRAMNEPPATVKWRRPDAVLLTDLLRRAAQFDSAYVTCKDGLAEGTAAFARVLRYEESLVLARDASVHTFADLPEGLAEYGAHYAEPPPPEPSPEEKEAAQREAGKLAAARAEWDRLVFGDTKKYWWTPWDDARPWYERKGGK